MESLVNNIIIFGASECGERAFYSLFKTYNIIAFCDNDEGKWGNTFCGIKVISPTLLKEHPESTLVIALYEKYRQVLFQLKNYWDGSVFLFTPYVDAFDLIEKSTLRELKWSDFNFNTESRIDNKEYSLDNISGDLVREGEYDDQVHIKRINKLPVTKKDNRKVVLIVANLFPPMGSGGVQRTTKFVKYLNSSKYRPIVLTRGYYTNIEAGDASLLDEVSGIDVIRIMSTPKVFDELSEREIDKLRWLYEFAELSTEWKQVFEDMFNRGECFLRPDNDILWVMECIEIIKERPDLRSSGIVFTTAGPYSSFLLGYWMKKIYKTKWVMDFRDAWCEDKEAVRVLYPFRLNAISLDNEIERRMTQTADLIVTAGERTQHYLYGYANEDNKVLCIKNGYDEGDFDGISYNMNPSVFRVLYNGQVYMNMDPLPLLYTINELINEGVILSNEICLEFNGQILKKIKDLIEENDKYRIVKFNGYKSHEESIRMAAEACLLIVFGQFGELANLTYTGKIFEYLRIGNPILSYSSDYGVQYDLLSETGLGITVGYEDNSRAKEYILELFNKWKSGEVLHKNMKGKIDQYSRECQANQLEEAFNEIMK